MIEWRPVPGFEGLYEVSNQGDVLSLRSGRLRVARPHARTGHVSVSLFSAGSVRTCFVHTLMLSAFVGPRPPGLVGCHNDGDPSNNTLENLRWDTQSANIRDAVRHGTHAEARKTHCKRGHAFDDANTHIRTDGKRLCRACNAARSRVVRAARKAASA